MKVPAGRACAIRARGEAHLRRHGAAQCSFAWPVLLSFGVSAPRSSPTTVPASAKPAATAVAVATFFATPVTLERVLDPPRLFVLGRVLDLLLAPNALSTFFRLVPTRFTARLTSPLLLPVFLDSYRTS